MKKIVLFLIFAVAPLPACRTTGPATGAQRTEAIQDHMERLQERRMSRLIR